MCDCNNFVTIVITYIIEHFSISNVSKDHIICNPGLQCNFSTESENRIYIHINHIYPCGVQVLGCGYEELLLCMYLRIPVKLEYKVLGG